MSSVDTRVVQMQFDNKQFEREMSTTMTSLKKLESSLKFDGASKGLEELNEASRKSASSFKEVENLACEAGFNIRDVWLKMATIFEYQIAGKLVNAAKGIISAFTIDPVKTGLAEYETQINAVQTILANTSSKGTTLDQVNSALDTLNQYADKTIYNFTEMTRNIGTFTAAGVDLDTSVKSIQGIANLAAVSGSTSQQASTAMYQLSQALSSGTVKLMDWNSVVNAGMGGQVFQDALKETARVHGINIDEMIEKEGSFRETLKNEWLSSEILTETLHKFTLSKEDMTEAQIAENTAMLKAQGYTDKQIEAIFELGKTATQAATKVKTFTQLMDTLKEAVQSGWTQSWEILIGDFEEAKELWTNVSDVVGDFINRTSEARNKMLQTWKDLGGRTELLEALKNIFAGLVNIIKPIAKAFREVFPPTTGEQLYNITTGFKELTERFKAWTENEDNLKSITTIFKGLFSVLKVGIKLLGAAAKVAGALFVTGAKLAGMLVKMVAPLFKFGDGLLKAVEAGNVFEFIADKMVSTISWLYQGIKSIVVSIGKSFGLFKDVDTSGLDGFLEGLKQRFAPIIKLGEGLWKIVTTVWNVIKKVASLIVKVVKDLSKGIADAIESGNYSNLLDIIDTVMVGGIAAGLIEFIKRIRDFFKDGSKFLESFSDIFEGITDTLKAFQRDLNAKALLKIAAAIAILVASLIALSFLEMDDMEDGLAVMGVLMAALFGGLALVAKMSNSGGGSKTKINITNLNNMGGAMIGLGLAVLALAGALKMLAGLSWDKIWPALTAISIFTVLLGTFMVVMSKVGKTTTTLNKTGLSIQRSGLAGAATTLIAFAGAIWILADSMLRFQGLSWQDIDQGVYIVGGLMIAMGTLSVLMSKFGKGGMSKSALYLIAFAGATWILAAALKELCGIDVENLIQGSIALALVMGILAVTTSGDGMKKGALSMLAFAGAIWILVPAIKRLGELEIPQIAQGVIAISAAMLAFSGAMRLMPKDGGLTRAFGFVALAAALLAISHAMTSLADIPLDGIIKAGVTIGGLLLVMGGVAKIAQKSIVGAAAIAVIAASIVLVAGALALVAMIPMESLAVGVVAIVAALSGLAAVAATLSLLGPMVLAGAGALAMVGAAMMLVAGALAIVAMIPMESIAVGVIAIVAALSGLGVLAATLSLLGPMVLAGAGALALIGAAMVLVAASTVIFAAGITALKSAFESFSKMAWGDFGKALAMITITVTALGLVSPVLALISPLMLIGSAAMLAFGRALIVVGAGLTAVGVAFGVILGAIANFIATITGAFASIPDKMGENGRDIVLGLINGIGGAIAGLFDLLKNIGLKILDIIKSALGIHSPSKEMSKVGKFTIEGFVQGFKSKVSAVLTNIKNFASKCLTTVKNGLASFGNTAKNAVVNFANGFKSKVSSAVTTVKNFASNCVNAIKTRVSGLWNTGKTAISNFASGIKNRASSALSAARNVASKCVTSVKNGISGFATAGKNAVSGFINGLKSKLSAAANTAWDVGKRALSSIKNALGIHSPSKEFEEVGMYSDEGLAGGLKKFAGVVGKSAADVGKTAVESLTTPMSHISDILNSDIDDDLTIRPVLDLSQVQADANQLGGMFGQQTVALAGVNAGLMNGNTRTLADIAAQMQKVNDAGNSDIVDAIAGLRSDFNNLSEAVSKMRVVMDTGVLVGEIAPGIDNTLGRITRHKWRGN